MARMIKKEEPNIVWSSDGSHLEPKKAKNNSPVEPSAHKIKIRLEKNARGGKLVTVVFELPDNPNYLKELAKKLKGHCGTGGTLKDGKIEIQGDHREKVKDFCQKLGFQVVLAGG